MKTPLDIITSLSHEFGTARYVMGGGGNTSCKDQETLWIKPSGTTLLSLTPESFIKMDRQHLAQLFTIETPADATEREALIKTLMAEAVNPETPGRASVEAPVHECFQARYVVHTHPTLANGLTCSLGGKAAVEHLFTDTLWIDYVDPGYTLSLRVRDALSEYRDNHDGHEPRLTWLENHGVFVVGDTADEIRETYDGLMQSLAQVYKLSGIDTEIPTPQDSPKTDTQTATSALLKKTLGEEAKVIVTQASVLYATGPVSPDHLVYAKSFVYEGLVTEAGIQAFKDKHGYLPRVVATKDTLFACGATASVAQRAAEFAYDAAQIRHFARAFGGVQYLTDRARKFLENWEVESYRSRQT